MARSEEKATAVAAVMALFDTIIESSVVGVRKPDFKIYQMACEAMQIEPHEALFLDDLGINLKPAKALGMTTIKVLSEAQALADLEQILGLSFSLRAE
jgi:putative hydrolase of the HAD superfamily